MTTSCPSALSSRYSSRMLAAPKPSSLLTSIDNADVVVASAARATTELMAHRMVKERFTLNYSALPSCLTSPASIRKAHWPLQWA